MLKLSNFSLSKNNYDPTTIRKEGLNRVLKIVSLGCLIVYKVLKLTLWSSEAVTRELKDLALVIPSMVGGDTLLPIFLLRIYSFLNINDLL